jgi:exonuclease VII small subunit
VLNAGLAQATQTIDAALERGRQAIRSAEQALSAVRRLGEQSVEGALRELNRAKSALDLISSGFGLFSLRREMHPMAAWKQPTSRPWEDPQIVQAIAYILEQAQAGAAAATGGTSRSSSLNVTASAAGVPPVHGRRLLWGFLGLEIPTPPSPRELAEEVVDFAKRAYNDAINAAKDAVNRAQGAINDARSLAERIEREARDKAAWIESNARSAYADTLTYINQGMAALQSALDSAETAYDEAASLAAEAQATLASALPELLNAWQEAQRVYNSVVSTTGSFINGLSDPSNLFRLEHASIGSDWSDLAHNANMKFRVKGVVLTQSFDIALAFAFDPSGASDILNKATDFLSGLDGLEVCGK